MEARRLLLITALLFGLCTALVTAAAGFGAGRSGEELTGAAPRSALSADYSQDPNAPRTAPLGGEVAAAAARDAQALGIALPGTNRAPEPHLPPGELPTTGDAVTTTEYAETASPPASGSNPLGIPAPSSVPVTPTAIAALAIVGALAAAYRLLRPSRD